MDCNMPSFRVRGHQSFTISQSLLKLMSTDSVMSSDHLILCGPPLLLLFPSESVLRSRWPKYWSFGFSSSPSEEDSGWFTELVWCPCCSRDSQESSVTPQFKRDNSSVLSLLYGPEKTPLLSLWLVLPMNHRRWDTGVSPLKTLKSFSGFSRFFLFPVVAMQMSAC